MFVGRRVSPELETRIKAMYAQKHSRDEIAQTLGLTVSSVRRYIEFFRSSNAELPPMKLPELPPQADPLKEAEERAARQRELKAERDLMNDVAGEKSFRTYLTSLIREVIKPLDAPPKYTAPKPTKDTVTESLLLHLSDWHAFETVKSEAVFGLNEYDAEAVSRRVERVKDSTLEIKQRLEGGRYRFPSLVISCNGDMVSGTIHEVEKHSEGRNIIQAVEETGLLLAKMIRDLAGSFEKVHVFCTSGNHGRLPDARKVQTKEPTRSWDYMIYTIAAAALHDCKNVTIERPNSWGVLFEVEGKLFYQGHGHFVKSWNSIPFYGLTRMTSRLGSVLSKHHKPVDYWLFGHFHVMGSIENAGGEYLINPCLIGPQEFGVHSMGDATAPGQMLFGVHPKHGITHRWRLNAEHSWPSAAQMETVKVRS